MAEEERLPNANSKEIRLFRSRGPYTTYSNPTWEIEASRNKGWLGLTTRRQPDVIATMKNEGITLEDIQQIYQKCCRDVAFFFGIREEDVLIDTVRIDAPEHDECLYNIKDSSILLNIWVIKWGGRKALRKNLCHEIAHACIVSVCTPEEKKKVWQNYRRYSGWLLHELVALGVDERYEPSNEEIKNPYFEIFDLISTFNQIRDTMESKSLIYYAQSVRNFAKWLCDKYGGEKIIRLALEVGKDIDETVQRVLDCTFNKVIEDYATYIKKTKLEKQLTEADMRGINWAIEQRGKINKRRKEWVEKHGIKFDSYYKDGSPEFSLDDRMQDLRETKRFITGYSLGEPGYGYLIVLDSDRQQIELIKAERAINNGCVQYSIGDEDIPKIYDSAEKIFE